MPNRGHDFSVICLFNTCAVSSRSTCLEGYVYAMIAFQFGETFTASLSVIKRPSFPDWESLFVRPGALSQSSADFSSKVPLSTKELCAACNPILAILFDFPLSESICSVSLCHIVVLKLAISHKTFFFSWPLILVLVLLVVQAVLGILSLVENNSLTVIFLDANAKSVKPTTQTLSYLLHLRDGFGFVLLSSQRTRSRH